MEFALKKMTQRDIRLGIDMYNGTRYIAGVTIPDARGGRCDQVIP